MRWYPLRRGVRLLAALMLAFGLGGVTLATAAAPASAAPACPSKPGNFSGKKIDLSKLDSDALRCAKLTNANLDGLDLVQRDLDHADLTGASLVGAKLGQADLTGATLDGAHFDNADLTQATMVGVQAKATSFRGADLTQAEITNANLTGVDLSGADLTQADLSHSELGGAVYTGAKFTQVTTNGTRMDKGLADKLANPDFASAPGWLLPVVIGGPIVLVVVITLLARIGQRRVRRALNVKIAPYMAGQSGGPGQYTGGPFTVTVGGAPGATGPVPPYPTMPAATVPPVPAPASPVDPLSQPWNPPVFPEFGAPVVNTATDSTQDAYNVIQDGKSSRRFGRKKD